VGVSDDGGVALDLVLNGRFLSQPLSGVQRVSLEVVRAIDGILAEGGFPHLRVRLAVPPGTAVAHLDLQRIGIVTTGGPGGNLWEQTMLPWHARRAALLCLGNTAPLLALLLGRQVGVMLHDQAYRLYPADYSRAYRLWHTLLDMATVRRAAPLFTVSDAERAVLTARYPGLSARIHVAPNGGWPGAAPDQTPDGADVRASDFDGYGLYVGALSQRKNMGGIMAVAVALARSRGRRFVLVGPVNAQVEALRAGLPDDVRDLIEFRGHVPDADMPALYRGAAYLLYPSFYEASGLPPSEAMLFGCPVVTSDLPVLHERCGDAALYCDPHAHHAIIASVEALLGDRALHRRLAERGARRARGFTWRAQALQILGAVQALAKPGRAASTAPIAAASEA
jgi:glycosyltransferase involved in cell wall biosynthesis